MSAVSAKYVHQETYKISHQYISQFSYWLRLLYAPGHTLIYYPSHHFPHSPRENALESIYYLSQKCGHQQQYVNLKLKLYEQLSF